MCMNKCKSSRCSCCCRACFKFAVIAVVLLAVSVLLAVADFLAAAVFMSLRKAFNINPM